MDDSCGSLEPKASIDRFGTWVFEMKELYPRPHPKESNRSRQIRGDPEAAKRRRIRPLGLKQKSKCLDFGVLMSAALLMLSEKEIQKYDTDYNLVFR